MKKFAFLSVMAIFLFACGQPAQKKEAQVKQAPQEKVVLTVDQLLEQAGDLADQEVVVKGTVMHVCQHGGERCFLMGSTEDFTIRVEAGEKIGTFSQEQMGSELEIAGVLKEVKTEAQAHNPGSEHGEGEEHSDDEETENAHQLIAKNQESAERIFFIEGISVKEN